MRRLLPWTGEGGKPSYLIAGDEESFVARLADNLEAVQLGMAEDLVRYVDTLMSQDKPSEVELRSAVVTLVQALRDVQRVAESRGARLPVPDDDDVSEEAAAAVAREVQR